MCAWGAGERGARLAQGLVTTRSALHQGLALVVRAGARQGYTLLHFDVAWRVGAGMRVVKGGGKGEGLEKREVRRSLAWTRSIRIKHGRLHESLSPIPPSSTRANFPDVSVCATCSGGSKDCDWHVEGSTRLLKHAQDS